MSRRDLQQQLTSVHSMLFLPEAGGPSQPVPATIDRRPGSVRRTSTIDTATTGRIPG